jgi:ribosomal protein S18 acetylase RimI-like enzyme
MRQVAPQIRRAQVHDAARVTGCVAAAYNHYVARIGKPPAPMLDDYANVIRRHTVFVLEERENIVGVLVLIRQEESLLLDNVAVHPDYQGKGFGKRLIELAETEARRFGFAALTLYTNEQMTENIGLYSKLGFVETERKQEQGFKRVYMRKILSQP